MPVRSALRIAPGSVAPAVSEDSGFETGVEDEYEPQEDRYVVRTVVAPALSPGGMKTTCGAFPPQANRSSCRAARIALQLGEDADAPWTTVADLTTNDGRIIPQWMATYVAQRGVKAERHVVIESSTASPHSQGSPGQDRPLEFDVVLRTASDWIAIARAASHIKGMKYHAGRQADG